MKRLVTIVLLTALAAPAVAMPVTLGREDIARAWLRLEEELHRHTLKPADRARLGSRFDVKTRAFFRGGFGEVVRGIDQITAELRGTSATDGAAAFAMAFRVRFPDSVFVLGSTKVTTALHGRMIYEVEVTPKDLEKLRYRLEAPDGTVVDEQELKELGTAWDLKLPLYRKELSPGLHTVRILGPGIDETVGRLPVLAEHPNAVRDRNKERIAKLPEGLSPHTLATVRARNALLVAKPGPLQTYAWLRDPCGLTKEVDGEITALEKGKDPYAGALGDLWRVVEVKGEAVPFRIFVPEGLTKPAPLVFFLHGAGADENAFFEGYGRGIARDLAAARRFIAVAPATVPMARKAGAFTTILDTVLAGHAVDEKRVYVVGHSMGAFATGFLARAHGDRLAAVCQIAGGTGRTGDDGPPVLFVHAGRDRILSLAVPAETKLLKVRKYPDEAHTWVVPRALPGVLDWLFERQKP